MWSPFKFRLTENTFLIDYDFKKRVKFEFQYPYKSLRQDFICMVDNDIKFK